jgi:hypothetical protein
VALSVDRAIDIPAFTPRVRERPGRRRGFPLAAPWANVRARQLWNRTDAGPGSSGLGSGGKRRRRAQAVALHLRTNGSAPVTAAHRLQVSPAAGAGAGA